MKTIVFELNEVPWRVMDWYCAKNPDSAFAKMLKNGNQFETVTEDSGHLHPWVTWSSLHRGVENDHHGIGRLGQDLSEVNQAYPAVWELLRRSGQTIGVGGSLQSYPVPPQPEAQRNISFYIPDTFSASPETLPPALTSFQGLSLRLTKENGRNVNGGTNSRMAAELLRAMPKIGISFDTVNQIGKQLLREKTDKTKLNRRRAMQSALYFDAYLRQLRSTKPHFSTFFTNHVAAAMHRFWAATFPDDYQTFDLPELWKRSYANEVEWSMSLADGFAARLMAFCERNPEFRLLVCSSMGQGATTAKLRGGSFQWKNVAKFFAVLDMDSSDYTQRLAMAPDVSVHLLSERAAERVRAVMPAVVAGTGGEWDIDDRNMLHAHISIDDFAERGLPEILIGNRHYTVEELGFDFVPDQDRVGVTAYHTPEGILMSWKAGETSSAKKDRTTISALDLAPAILREHGVTPPDYMRRSALALA